MGEGAVLDWPWLVAEEPADAFHPTGVSELVLVITSPVPPDLSLQCQVSGLPLTRRRSLFAVRVAAATPISVSQEDSPQAPTVPAVVISLLRNNSGSKSR